MSEKFDELLDDLERSVSNYTHTLAAADYRLLDNARDALVAYVTGLEEEVERLREEIEAIGKAHHKDVVILGGLYLENKSLKAENARLREAQRWIPVSERLPEKPGKCEAYIPRLDELPFDFVDFGIGFEGHKFFLHGMDITEFVTHWRPILQPPEVE